MSEDDSEISAEIDAVADILAQELLKILDNSVRQLEWLGVDPSSWGPHSVN